MNLDRALVFDVLSDEREYQIKKWGETSAGDLHTPTEFLVYMQDYLTQAFNQVTRDSGVPVSESGNVLATIRKITAMGVACMEQWGAPNRYPLRLPAYPQLALPAAPPEVVAEDAAIAGIYEPASFAPTPEPPSADPGGGVAEEPPVDSVYPEWVTLSAKEASECDETCPSDCPIRDPIEIAIWNAYQRGREDYQDEVSYKGRTQ